jgi:hypothetical protein
MHGRKEPAFFSAQGVSCPVEIEPADKRHASLDEDSDCEFYHVRRAALGTRWLS